MESECDDNATMKIGPDPPDSQESTQGNFITNDGKHSRSSRQNNQEYFGSPRSVTPK